MVPPPSATTEMQALVDHAAWVRQLARKLVGDAHLADDLAQETCLAALVHRPSTDRPLRGWLATVLRNLIHQKRRGDDRRGRREQHAARDEATESTLEVVEKVSVHHAVIDAVRALDEPYRSTLLLRYFENLTPSTIALRTSVPVSTVKTRLARGLERLRAKLDDEHGGDGRAWLAALVPLIHEAGGPSATIGALAVSTPLKISAAVLVTAGLAYVFTSQVPDAVAPPTEDVTAVVDAPEVRSEPTDARAAHPTPPAAEARAAVAAPPKSVDAVDAPTVARAQDLTGRVLDEHGRPLPGVPLRLITYPGPGETEEGPVDSESQDTAVSGSAGRFTFARNPRAGRVVAAGDRFATIYAGIAGAARGSADSIVVVGPRIQLAGWVTDAEDTPLDGVHLSVELPEGFRNRFTQVLDFTFAHGANTDSTAEGRFAFEPLAFVDGARLEARLDGFEGWSSPLPLHGDEHVEIRLVRPVASASALTGLVVDELGLPVPQADVAFGVERTATDELGQFTFDLADPESMNVMGARFGIRAQRVTAVKAGYLPATLNLPLDPETGAPPPSDGLVLQLGGAALELTGRVIDPAGEPLEGVEVWIKEGSLFAFGESGGQVLESLLAGEPERGWRTVTTGSSGSFALNGLDDRAYIVAAHDPATLLRTESSPVHPHDGPVTLTLDRSDLWRRVAGRVVSRSGEPLPGVRVSPATDVFLTKHQGRTFGTSHGGREGVTTDEDGHFELEGVPRNLVYLRIGGENVIADDWGRHAKGGLAALSDGRIEELEIVAALRLHMKVELVDPSEADTFGVLDGEGAPIRLNLISATSRRENDRMPIVDGRSAVISANDSAATIVLYRDGVEVRRAPLELARGEVSIVTP